MDAPPVQYVTTSDGYNIAFTVNGSGPTVLWAPGPFGNFLERWNTQTYRPTYEALASRFTLVQYDMRGEGLSTRNIPEGITLEHFGLDLEAVMERLGAEPVIVFAEVLSGHVAVRYAVRRPERVAGLILNGVNLDDQLEGVRYLEPLARESWENFLKMPAYNFYRLDPPDRAIKILLATRLQADFLTHIRQPAASLREFLPRVKTPTLVVSVRGAYGPRLTGEEEGRRIAALVPDARLLLLNPGEYLERTPGLIAEFAASLAVRDVERRGAAPGDGIADTLSPREIEVVRLLAQGKSNAQIADELVISINTVRRHASNIYDKTGVANRAQAAIYARDHGLA
jgi:DNA-binding CsgD family transcriptional regulator